MLIDSKTTKSMYISVERHIKVERYNLLTPDICRRDHKLHWVEDFIWQYGSSSVDKTTQVGNLVRSWGLTREI